MPASTVFHVTKRNHQGPPSGLPGPLPSGPHHPPGPPSPVRTALWPRWPARSAPQRLPQGACCSLSGKRFAPMSAWTSAHLLQVLDQMSPSQGGRPGPPEDVRPQPVFILTPLSPLYILHSTQHLLMDWTPHVLYFLSPASEMLRGQVQGSLLFLSLLYQPWLEQCSATQTGQYQVLHGCDLYHVVTPQLAG